ncbi:class I SAM-dependent methyltransferase [Jeotgalibacillus sp. ET6]|uniref:class I SAM-dependent methyltransferase n=1 Tax=Jeotgalibacillus sp. ET6 TaxID=3037260 RepID=UPI0024186B38|nr:class I SAM-dependent methyltransferase [Jeotgalibacillus sp. ET6]MDG5471697.1 class I SAM-dependent methyltransferase [Jeotgalibacillus sp. ET6]
MLDQKGFNLWANEYDKTVQVSEENNVYPFAGYKKSLNMIFNEVMKNPQSTVLDIGFGTGVLTGKLYEHGHSIDGIDFSSEMIRLAQMKMPEANLMEWDFSKGLPKSVKEKQYDWIISTYALHHLTDQDKVDFIQGLLPMLSKTGKIIIGDIAFDNREQLEHCKKENLAHWDHDEFYFAADEIREALNSYGQCEYQAVSHCGGIFVITT